jgi:hypothetical protein
MSAPKRVVGRVGSWRGWRKDTFWCQVEKVCSFDVFSKLWSPLYLPCTKYVFPESRNITWVLSVCKEYSQQAQIRVSCLWKEFVYSRRTLLRCHARCWFLPYHFSLDWEKMVNSKPMPHQCAWRRPEFKARVLRRCVELLWQENNVYKGEGFI